MSSSTTDHHSNGINADLYTPAPEQYDEVPSTSSSDGTKWLKKYHILKTFTMVFIWFCMGCYATINTTAIDDLRNLIDVEYEKFSRAYIAKSVGMLVGSFISGPVADSFPAKIDLVISVSVAVMGGAALVLPLCPNLPLMGLSFCLQGMGQAAVSASGNAHVMAIWGQENSSPVLALHFGYAVGNVLGPVIVGPFLKDLPGNTTQDYMPHHTFYSAAESNYKVVVGGDLNVFSDSSISFDTVKPLMDFNSEPVNRSKVVRRELSAFSDLPNAFDTVETSMGFSSVVTNRNDTQIWIPYVASGSLGLLIALIFFIYFLVGLPQEFQTISSHDQNSEVRNARSVLSPGNCTGGNVAYGVQIFPLIMLFYISFVGKDASFLTFTLPIAIDKHLPLDFTKKSADLLMIVSAVCAAGGRFGFALIAKILSIQVIVFIQVFFTLAAQIMLLIWGLESVIIFWVGSCVFNTFSSPCFPSVLAWADKYVKMTAVAVALVDISTGTGSFIFAWLAGYVFQYKENGAQWVLYLSTGCGVVMTLVMIALQILASCHGNRFETSEDSAQNNEDEEPLYNPINEDA